MDIAEVTFTQHYTDVIETKFGTKTKNSFITDDGTRYESWKAPVAAAVAAHMNEPIKVLFEKKEHNGYVNLEIKELLGVDSSAPAPPPVSDNADEPVMDPTPTRQIQVNGPSASSAQVEKEARITRTAAFKTTVESMTQIFLSTGDERYNPLLNPDTVIDYVDEVLDYLITGSVAERTAA